MKAAQEKWVAEFQTANSGVTINYKPDGSGAGREAFAGGGADFAGSDRAFKDEELGAGKFAGCAADSSALNLPVYISPIAIVFNVDGVTELTLDAKTVAGIFTGKITKWNDAAIAATNSGVNLPDAGITAVHRADGSGTTNNFTDTLSKLAGDVWTYGAARTRSVTPTRPPPASWARPPSWWPAPRSSRPLKPRPPSSTTRRGSRVAPSTTSP
jgi:phosphate transport system substrate-binding protein